LSIRPCIYKLRVDSNAIPGFLHAAFHDIGNTKGLPEFALVLGFPAVGRNAATADDLKRGDIRQIGDDSFLDAIGEISVFCVVIKNIERQHCDTFF
jgi:tryptophan synthase beta subunit